MGVIDLRPDSKDFGILKVKDATTEDITTILECIEKKNLLIVSDNAELYNFENGKWKKVE